MDRYSERQRQIIHAAIELISEHGIQALTTKKLARKLDLSEGAIYRHFGSKDEILEGIIRTLEKMKLDAARSVDNNEDQDPLEKIEDFFMSCLQNLSDNPTVAAVAFAEEIFRYDSRLSEKVFGIISETQAIMKKIISEGQNKGLIKKDLSSDNIAIIVTGAMRMIVTQWRLSSYSFDLCKKGKSVLENIFNLIKTKN